MTYLKDDPFFDAPLAAPPDPDAAVPITHDGTPPPDAPKPLRIDYSTTRVDTAALARLRCTPGVVKGDRSALAESYKMLRNQVLQRMRADGHKVLAITSPRDTAGKSLVAVNLALAIAAEYDCAVLLIDADLGAGGLQRHFGLDGAPGLCDHLTRGTPIADMLVNPGVDRLVFLPAGRGAVPDSAELLGTRAAQQLIRAMKERYADRYMIVDLPPLLDTADALAFLPHADTTLLVLEEHGSAVADTQHAAELLAPFNLVGTVISQAQERLEAPRLPWYRRWFGAQRGRPKGQPSNPKRPAPQ